MRQRFVTFAVFGLILVGLAEWNLRARKLVPLSSLNDFWLEFCAGNAGDKLASPAVTVVRINDDYEPLSLGEDSPAAEDGRLSRLDFATILGFVAKQNPKAVTFLPTPSFDESLVLNQTDIVPLKDAAMQLPRLVVASNVSNDGEQAADASPLNYAPIQVAGDPAEILAFTRTVRRPDPQLLANGDPVFKTIESARNLSSEEELRIPLVARYRDQLVPSITLASVARHAGIANDQIVIDLSGAAPVIRLGEMREIPIESDGTFIVPPFAGVKRGMSSIETAEDGSQSRILDFTSLTVDELAYTGEEDDEVAKRILASFQPKFDSLKRNLVVVGFDRTADRRFTTAKGEALSETMLMARAMATIQSGRFIELWPGWLRWVAVIAIAAIAAFLFRQPQGRFLALWALAFLLFFGACVLAFRSTLSWTPPFFAFALFGLMLLIGLLLKADSGSTSSTEEEAGES